MPRKKSEALTRESWLQAGQVLLAKHGIRGVKLKPLIESLKISSGSFYHHFRDIEDFRSALADYYGGQHVLSFLDGVRSQSDDAAERLAIVSRLHLARDMLGVTIAMRAWAHSDSRARAAVNSMDATVTAFLLEHYLLLGFNRREAELCAFLMLAVGTMSLDPPDWISREQLPPTLLGLVWRASGREHPVARSTTGPPSVPLN